MTLMRLTCLRTQVTPPTSNRKSVGPVLRDWLSRYMPQGAKKSGGRDLAQCQIPSKTPKHLPTGLCCVTTRPEVKSVSPRVLWPPPASHRHQGVSHGDD